MFSLIPDQHTLDRPAIEKLRATLAPTRTWLSRVLARMAEREMHLSDPSLTSAVEHAVAALNDLDRKLAIAAVHHIHAPHDPDRIPSKRA